MRSIFLKLSSSSIVKNAIKGASSGFGVFFFGRKSGHFVPRFRGPARLGRCICSPIDVPLAIAGSVFFSSEESLRDFHQHSIHFDRKGDPCAENEETVENLIIIASTVTVDPRSINWGIAQYKSTKRLLQDFCEAYRAHMLVTRRRKTIAFWLPWTAAMLNVDGAYADKLWRPRLLGHFLVNRKHCASQCKNGDIETGTSDKRPSLFVVVTGRKKASFLHVPVLSCSFSTLRRRSAHWQRRFKWSVLLLLYSLYFLRMAICSMWGHMKCLLLLPGSCLLYSVSYIS